MKVIAKVEFKKHVANTYIFGIVIGKLTHYKEFSLIILLVIDKSLRISLYNLDLPYVLAIIL